MCGIVTLTSSPLGSKCGPLRAGAHLAGGGSRKRRFGRGMFFGGGAHICAGGGEVRGARRGERGGVPGVATPGCAKACRWHAWVWSWGFGSGAVPVLWTGRASHVCGARGARSRQATSSQGSSPVHRCSQHRQDGGGTIDELFSRGLARMSSPLPSPRPPLQKETTPRPVRIGAWQNIVSARIESLCCNQPRVLRLVIRPATPSRAMAPGVGTLAVPVKAELASKLVK